MWKWCMLNHSQINEEGQLDKMNPELQLCSRRIFRFCSLTLIYHLGQ